MSNSVDGVGIPIARQNLLAVDDDWLRSINKSNRSARPCRPHRNRDLIAGFERVFRPPGSSENAGAVHLDGPIYQLPTAVLHIEIQRSMRIGECEFGHNSTKSNGLRTVVGSGSVMPEY